MELGPADGPVVMLSHGFGCDQNMWRLVAPVLAEHFRVVLFDHVGSGRSDLSAWREERYSSLEGYADDVREICRELDLREVVFVGHSVSAMIGVLAANREPTSSPGWCCSPPPPATSTTTPTGAASAVRTSRSCWSRWTATISAGRRRWRR
ncbi:alpha/beta fold hydrolase [Streptomyces decoyicus]|uniref:alpha/beta fold hydrolase n=1 Tax=Streptomyces decoyicus TaxID=249567 RepID=UPI000A62789E|nr:alpha/beta hydrolase [Streptomyces decoyicus]